MLLVTGPREKRREKGRERKGEREREREKGREREGERERHREKEDRNLKVEIDAHLPRQFQPPHLLLCPGHTRQPTPDYGIYKTVTVHIRQSRPDYGTHKTVTAHVRQS